MSRNVLIIISSHAKSLEQEILKCPPSVCLSVTFSFCNQTHIAVFSRNFAGTCTMPWGVLYKMHILHFSLFSNVRFQCKIPTPGSNLGRAVVSLTHSKQTNITNVLILHQNVKKRQQYNYTVCLGNAFYGDIKPMWFVEWMEANVLFGAAKVRCYLLYC